MIKISHRGAAGHAPENTLAAFKKGIELGADYLELDVHICKTGELVVIHDDTVNRTTNGEGLVAEKSLEELKTLDAGLGQQIPTLKEVLDLVDKQTKLNIEIKKPDTGDKVLEIIENYVYNKKWSYKHFLISSFNHPELHRLKEKDIQIRLAPAMIAIPQNLSNFAKKLEAYAIVWCREFLTSEIVEHAHNNNIKIFAWTANEQHEIDRLKELKVDGIISNNIEKI